MSTFSANVLQLLAKDSVEGFTLVELGFDTPLRHTTAPANIVISTIGTFVADNGLLSVEPPRLSTIVDREAYKITYADPNFVFRPYFEDGVVGKYIRVYVGFYNTLTTTLGGAAPGFPLTDEADLLKAYEGVIDTHGYAITDDEVTVVIEGSSPMADLDLVKPFITTQNQLKQLGLTDDTSFDQVYTGSAPINLLWGKI